jgi:hypothetical protein
VRFNNRDDTLTSKEHEEVREGCLGVGMNVDLRLLDKVDPAGACQVPLDKHWQDLRDSESYVGQVCFG